MEQVTLGTGRASLVAASCMAAVFLVGAMATASPLASNGFNSTEDVPYFSAGNLNGQGTTTNGWAGPWVATVSGTETAPVPFNVVSGGSPVTAASPGDPDQHLQMFGCTSGSNKVERAMNPWSGDFTLEFDARWSGVTPTATHQLQLESTSSTLRPLNIKWDVGGNFKVNDLTLMQFNNPPAGFLNMVDNWVTVRVVCDWETATFDVYWSNDTDGSLAHLGQKVGFKDGGFDGNSMSVLQMEMSAPKVGAANPTSGMEIDRITLVPEPVTLAMLALGCLPMLRRRRHLGR